MENKLENFFKNIKSIFDFDIARRAFLLMGIAASVAMGIGVYQWIQEPIYRPLDIQITDRNLSPVVDALEKANIPYKLNEATGVISVPATDTNKARIKLSAAGIQRDEGFNFSFLNDNKKIGSSQFLENARYLRALEQDLAKSISSIHGISSTIVHIAKPQSNIFVDENAKTTASVILTVTPGYDGDREKIRAIIQLVAASVPELDPSQIAITDQYGHELSSSLKSPFTQNQEQLNYQNNLERYYEKRLQSLLIPIVGDNKVRINVNADLDFTRQEVAKESFDPNEKIIRSEQTVEESSTSAASGGVPGSLSNQPPSNNAQQGAQGQGGQNKSEKVKNYEISKSTTYVKESVPKVHRLSVAVVVDDDLVLDPKTRKKVSTPLSKGKINDITNLVKSSIGFKTDRGDVVTVINSHFIPIEPVVDAPTKLWDEPWFWDMVKKVTGMLLGFGFLFILYRKLAPELFPKKAKGQLVQQPPSGKQNIITAEMIHLKNEQINILKELVSHDPNKVAGVIKKWVAR
ncbi:MAG: flagellar basal-body MS-ring/collar protein FliF [Legionella sp.]|nr:flagellar basal-body MS-ring/collar protein FliF [Legionella sp.]